MFSLKNRILITGIKKKTTAKFYKDIKEGDIILIQMPLMNLRGASNGMYSPWICLENLTTLEACQKKYHNGVNTLLNCFEFEEF